MHLQYLGYPIANDPLYSNPAVWGPKVGRGGVDLVDQTSEDSRAAAIARRVAAASASASASASSSRPRTPQLPSDQDRLNGVEVVPEGWVRGGRLVDAEIDREYDNIDITSPIRLSHQARVIIAKLRRMRDEQEDWVK